MDQQGDSALSEYHASIRRAHALSRALLAPAYNHSYRMQSAIETMMLTQEEQVKNKEFATSWHRIDLNKHEQCALDGYRISEEFTIVRLEVYSHTTRASASTLPKSGLGLFVKESAMEKRGLYDKSGLHKIRAFRIGEDRTIQEETLLFVGRIITVNEATTTSSPAERNISLLVDRSKYTLNFITSCGLLPPAKIGRSGAFKQCSTYGCSCVADIEDSNSESWSCNIRGKSWHCNLSWDGILSMKTLDDTVTLFRSLYPQMLLRDLVLPQQQQQQVEDEEIVEDSGTLSQAVAEQVDQSAASTITPQKRGRGRPKGSLNKTPEQREAEKAIKTMQKQLAKSAKKFAKITKNLKPATPAPDEAQLTFQESKHVRKVGDFEFINQINYTRYKKIGGRMSKAEIFAWSTRYPRGIIPRDTTNPAKYYEKWVSSGKEIGGPCVECGIDITPRWRKHQVDPRMDKVLCQACYYNGSLWGGKIIHFEIENGKLKEQRRKYEKGGSNEPYIPPFLYCRQIHPLGCEKCAGLRAKPGEAEYKRKSSKVSSESIESLENVAMNDISSALLAPLFVNIPEFDAQTTAAAPATQQLGRVINYPILVSDSLPIPDPLINQQHQRQQYNAALEESEIFNGDDNISNNKRQKTQHYAENQQQFVEKPIDFTQSTTTTATDVNSFITAGVPCFVDESTGEIIDLDALDQTNNDDILNSVINFDL